MPDQLTLLGTTSQLEARIWHDALAQESIPVLIRSAHPLGPAGYVPTFGDVNVYVRAADERRARWIIGDFIEPHITVPTSETEEQPQEARQTAAE